MLAQISRTLDCEGAFVNLQVSTFVSSHSPEIWTNPEEFNPYRFDDEEVAKRYERTNDLFRSPSLVCDSRFSVRRVAHDDQCYNRFSLTKRGALKKELRERCTNFNSICILFCSNKMCMTCIGSIRVNQ